MYFTYLLKSNVNDDLYIGSTDNLERRVEQHNQGKVKSTKPYRPWKLVGYETFMTRSEAVQQERFLKTGQQKERLKKIYGQVAK